MRLYFLNSHSVFCSEYICSFCLFEYTDIRVHCTQSVFFQFLNVWFMCIMCINQNTYLNDKKNVNGRLYLKSILKYFLSIRILGRLTASAEVTSVPLSSLSVLPSQRAGWIVRDKGEYHSDNYHGSCPSQFTMSTLYTLSLCCRVQVLARRVIYEHSSN